MNSIQAYGLFLLCIAIVVQIYEIKVNSYPVSSQEIIGFFRALFKKKESTVN